jgi:hypothetical protein
LTSRDQAYCRVRLGPRGQRPLCRLGSVPRRQHR